RSRRGIGGKNSAGTNRKLYAVKRTSCLGRESARCGSSTHAHEDETINIREEHLGCGRQEGIATHPTLPRSAFLYAAIHFRVVPGDETQDPSLPAAFLYGAVLAHSSRYHPRAASVLGARLRKPEAIRSVGISRSRLGRDDASLAWRLPDSPCLGCKNSWARTRPIFFRTIDCSVCAMARC